MVCRYRSLGLLRWFAALLILAALFAAVAAPPVGAAPTLPPGFADELVVGEATPTALAFTPDGRMLVSQQSGQLLVYRGNALQGTALDLAATDRVCANSERGLLGIAVDPAFASNRHIYLFYTFKKHDSCSTNQPTTDPVNRVSRFTLSDSNAIALGGETVLIDNMPSPNGNHNAGDLNFGKDGLLYITIGEGGVSAAARQPHVLAGKVLRVAPDGTIPAGNPFQGVGTARCNVTGQTTPGQTCQEIFASGLRNPFRLAFDPNAAGTRFLINDVGQSTWEEIDVGAAGADYGWPVREGFCAAGSTSDCGAPPAGMTNPIYAYGHSSGCRSITGGAFVPNGVWSADYDGAYIFGDFLCGKLFTLRQGAGGTWVAAEFVTGMEAGAVHLRFGPHNGGQALYYTTYANDGEIRRISQGFTDVPPGDSAYGAIAQLRGRGLVAGYTAAGCAERGLAAPCFVPGDTSLRAQMAVLIVRAMGWSGEQANNPFTDRGGLDAELWDAVGILAAREVALGYGDGRYGPNDEVTQAQVVSFITRAMIERGHWQLATADDPAIYPNVPASTGHRLDLITYVQNTGALPDYPSGANWASWNTPATRGWFARVLWQALDDFVAP